VIFSSYLPEHTIYVNTITHGDNLLIGALLAQMFSSFPEIVERIAKAGGFLVESTLFFGLPVYYSLLASHTLSPSIVTATYFVSAILSTALVMVIGFGNGPISRVLGLKVPVFLGGLTYAGLCFTSLLWVPPG